MAKCVVYEFFAESQNDAMEQVSDGAEITKAFEFLSEEEGRSESGFPLLALFCIQYDTTTPVLNMLHSIYII